MLIYFLKKGQKDNKTILSKGWGVGIEGRGEEWEAKRKTMGNTEEKYKIYTRKTL